MRPTRLTIALDAADAEALAKGATLLQAIHDLDAPEGRVCTDPAGHPFCLCWG